MKIKVHYVKQKKITEHTIDLVFAPFLYIWIEVRIFLYAQESFQKPLSLTHTQVKIINKYFKFYHNLKE